MQHKLQMLVLDFIYKVDSQRWNFIEKDVMK